MVSLRLNLALPLSRHSQWGCGVSWGEKWAPKEGLKYHGSVHQSLGTLTEVIATT